MKDNKGFTLVELLAVIVILAIIMIIAIPAVLSTMETARRKTFEEYIQKIYINGEKKYVEDISFGSLQRFSQAYYVYPIKDSIGLAGTGNFNGYFVVFNDGEETSYSILLFDNNYGFYDKVYSNTESINLNESFKTEVGTINDLNNYFKGKLRSLAPSDLDFSKADSDELYSIMKTYWKNKDCHGGKTYKIVNLGTKAVEDLCS